MSQNFQQITVTKPQNQEQANTIIKDTIPEFDNTSGKNQAVGEAVITEALAGMDLEDYRFRVFARQQGVSLMANE